MDINLAVWEGDYKMITYLESDEYFLFNIKRDKDELENLIGKEPEVVQHLRGLIRTNLERANEGIRNKHGEQSSQ